MPFSKIYKFLKNIVFCLFLSVLISSCGNVGSIFERKEPIDPDARKRARDNAKEGRGIVFGSLGKKSTTYQFATSNPLWRASLDTLDFMVLATVDYAGGLIISDWYSTGQSSNESIKVSIRFLTNEIRSDALDIIVFNKKCDLNLINCKIIKNNGILVSELKKEILKKAIVYKKEGQDKKK